MLIHIMQQGNFTYFIIGGTNILNIHFDITEASFSHMLDGYCARNTLTLSPKAVVLISLT